MWYMITFLIGVVAGGVGMYFVAPKLAAVRAKVVAALRTS